MLAAQDYGPLKEVVSLAGSIIAAGAAIGLAWRGRANWEPSEEDVPAGAQKVGGLIGAVLIALIFANWSNEDDAGKLVTTALVALGLTLVFLVLYGCLVGMQTYKFIEADGTPERIIGGFWLTKKARKIKAERQLDVQRLLEGAAYEIDKVWSRPSRQLAKTSFVLAYLGLTTSGTIALAAGAMRLGLAVG